MQFIRFHLFSVYTVWKYTPFWNNTSYICHLTFDSNFVCLHVRVFWQLIPQISSLAWFTTAALLILVLSITAVKDAADDIVSRLQYTDFFFFLTSKQQRHTLLCLDSYFMNRTDTKVTTKWTTVKWASSLMESESFGSFQIFCEYCIIH